jgi:hypothetical protein
VLKQLASAAVFCLYTNSQASFVDEGGFFSFNNGLLSQQQVSIKGKNRVIGKGRIRPKDRTLELLKPTLLKIHKRKERGSFV